MMTDSRPLAEFGDQLHGLGQLTRCEETIDHSLPCACAHLAGALAIVEKFADRLGKAISVGSIIDEDAAATVLDLVLNPSDP
jgi:hypothetical protein